MQVTTSNKDTRGDTNQQSTRRHEPARHEDTPTTRHKVQGMQVITSNKHQPQGHTTRHEDKQL